MQHVQLSNVMNFFVCKYFLLKHTSILYMYLYVCVCVCVYVCVYVCMYVCMYACVHACMHACMYMYYICAYMYMLYGCRWVDECGLMDGRMHAHILYPYMYICIQIHPDLVKWTTYNWLKCSSWFYFLLQC